MPTNAGTYRLTPSALTLSSGDLTNYQGVTYASGLLTINKVNQTPITIGQYDAFPGVSTYPLNVYEDLVRVLCAEPLHLLALLLVF